MPGRSGGRSIEAERAIAAQIAKAGGQTVSRLGLRFDRVVVRVVGDLRGYAASGVPAGTAIIFTLTAPIRSPAKTIGALKLQIDALLHAGAGGRDRTADVCGNAVRLRLARSTRAHRLVGIVHNRDVDAKHLLDMAERWLRAGKGASQC